jgi:hypothetical protein
VVGDAFGRWEGRLGPWGRRLGHAWVVVLTGEVSWVVGDVFGRWEGHLGPWGRRLGRAWVVVSMGEVSGWWVTRLGAGRDVWGHGGAVWDVRGCRLDG